MVAADYYEVATRRTQWEHPFDPYFKDLVGRARNAIQAQREELKASVRRQQTAATSPTSPAGAGTPRGERGGAAAEVAVSEVARRQRLGALGGGAAASGVGRAPRSIVG